MGVRPVSLDHVNIFVRNAERSHRWYTDIFGLHTQDTMTHQDTGRLRAVFLSADPDHAHDIALFDVGEDAPGLQKGQVGLNHVAWRMASLDDLAAMYHRLQERRRPHDLDRRLLLGPRRQRPRGVLRAAARRVASRPPVLGRGPEGPLPRPLGRAAPPAGAGGGAGLSPAQRFTNPGMTSLASHASCSSMAALGVPMLLLRWTYERPGKRSSSDRR
jgi:catechol 2,3-dioxygenase-like lactoylglutathione lyase family enzyme